MLLLLLHNGYTRSTTSVTVFTRERQARTCSPRTLRRDRSSPRPTACEFGSGFFSPTHHPLRDRSDYDRRLGHLPGHHGVYMSRASLRRRSTLACVLGFSLASSSRETLDTRRPRQESSPFRLSTLPLCLRCPLRSRAPPYREAHPGRTEPVLCTSVT